MADSLLETLRFHAEHRRGDTALIEMRDGLQQHSQITFAELDEQARAIACALRARKLAGQRALLLYPSGIEFVCCFFGCLYAGTIAVPAPPPQSSRLKRSLPRLQGIIKDCDAAVVLTEKRTDLKSCQMSLAASHQLDWIETDGLPERVHPADPEMAIEHQPESVAYLQYTSGSIGEPKGIEISHFNLGYHARYLQSTCQYDSNSVSVTWMPNFHDWGLVEGLIAPVFNGTPCYIMSPMAFLKRPLQWLQAISRFRGTHSQGPSFAYEHCLRRIPSTRIPELDLSSWRAAGIAAEPINFDVMQAFLSAFEPYGFRWKTFCPAFGLGEATLMASCCNLHSEPSALHLNADHLEKGQAVKAKATCERVRTVVSCGIAFGDTDLLIVDPVHLTRLADGVVGEIWIDDPAVAMGYWNRPQDTEETFRAALPNDDRNFLRTGDLGFITGGQLYVTGRLKDLIIIRGSNHHPQDIEWTAQAVSEHAKGLAAAAFSITDEGREEVVLLLELAPKRLPDNELSALMKQIVERVADEHEIVLHDLLLLPRGSIPKTASGKIRRRAGRNAYQANELAPLARWRERPMQTNSSGTLKMKQYDSTSQSQNESKSTADQLIKWLREYADSRVNSLLMDQRRSVPPHIILDFGNHGLFGLQAPISAGGCNLGYWDTARVLQQLAAIDLSLATLVFLGNTNGLLPLWKFGSQDLKANWLPELASGRRLAAFALSEPVAGSNIGAITTRADRQQDGRIQITGQKRWNGSAWADLVTVISREFDHQGNDCGISAFVVPQGSKGLQVGEEALTMGLRGIVQNNLTLDSVVVEAGQRLGRAGDGWTLVNQTLSIGRLAAAEVCLGAMKRCSQLMYRYADRRQISTGRLLEHPNVHRQMAETCARIQVIENAVKHLTTVLDAGDSLDPVFTMAMKVMASEFLNEVSAWGVQLLGGRGYMENNEVARIFRDARAMSIGEGPNESLTGHLGQQHHATKLAAWLRAHECPDLAELLQRTTDEIRERCDARKKHMPAGKGQLWAQYLCGEVVLNSILAGVQPKGRSATGKATQSWCAKRLNAVIANTLVYSEKGPAELPIEIIASHFEHYANDIGLMQQQLPGADIATDPMLEADLPLSANGEIADLTENRPGLEDQPNVNNRQKLKRLLRNKLSVTEKHQDDAE